MAHNWWSSAKVAKSRSARPAAGRRGRALRPSVEMLEERSVPDAGFRSITGLGNNAANPTWGSAGVSLLRTAAAAYADGISSPVVGSPARPSPRLISDRIVAQTTEERVLNDRQMAAMIYGWGQFLDHDFGLTTGASPAEPLNISVPIDPNDPFSTAVGGPGVIFFGRSEHVAGTGTSTSNPR
jgi:hypothetical protein